jgi:hypothetical protein
VGIHAAEMELVTSVKNRSKMDRMRNEGIERERERDSWKVSRVTSSRIKYKRKYRMSG